ncbi:oxidoreductase, short chain dehydrogenase/reductase family protein, partial [Streptomyces ipomoeae 91-03]
VALRPTPLLQQRNPHRARSQ